MDDTCYLLVSLCPGGLAESIGLQLSAKLLEISNENVAFDERMKQALACGFDRGWNRRDDLLMSPGSDPN